MKIKKFISIFISSILLICLFSFPLSFDNYYLTTSSAEEEDNVEYTKGKYTIEFSDYSPIYRQTFTYNKYIDHIEIISVSHNRGMAYNTLAFLHIPDEIEGLPVTTITGLNLKSITEFTVPDSVTRIDNCTLEPWYTNYKDSCPDGVIYIGKIAYGYKGDKSHITDIEIKEGTKAMTRFLGGALDASVYGSSVSSITLPSSLERIPESAFEGCRNLKEVIIPEGVKEIGDKAFYGCSSLEYVYMPDSVVQLGKEAFSSYRILAYGSCKSLERVRLSDNITELNTRCFYNCKNLKEINLPKKLTVIGESAFQNCSQLKSIVLPDNLERIESSAFLRSGLIKVSTEYKEADENELLLSKNINYIGNDAFSNLDSVGVETDPKIWNNIELPVNLSEALPSVTKYAKSLKVYNPDCKMYGSESAVYSKYTVVYGYIGSTAEEFANESKCKFIPLDSILLKGDCNCDNVVNIADLVMLQKFILGCEKLLSWKNADLCEDENIDVFDMVLLRKLLVEQTK
ncbi:leucine-rich repeat protein [Ruminococcus sp.]|uniref:leucine-rich repeat protein n=1 Tax=Ruminococcus sp. TaxID=41978 RepID=UPI0025DCE188|nr:leucine-rich repeat protein [Ruminococcus sp.]MBR1430039.1 leucine-rich repeat protein [Ruminococcus sp.]